MIVVIDGCNISCSDVILNCRLWRIADETEVQRSRDTEEQGLRAVMSPGCGLGWSLVWRGG